MAFLSACAVNTPAHITESTGRPVHLPSIELVKHDEDGKQRTELADRLALAIRGHGIEVSTGAPFIGDYAIGSRSAQSTIVSIDSDQAQGQDQAQDSGNSTKVSSKRRQAWLLDGCKANRVRASFALFERSTGKMIYRGTAEADSCEAEPTAITALANALASDLVGADATEE